MQRWSVVAMSLLFVGAILFVVVRPRLPQATALAAASASAAPSTPVASPRDAGIVSEKSDGGSADDEFSRFPDGGPVPALPADAPSDVDFGVILFAYQGAEFAGPEAVDRSKALEKAKAVLPEAQKAFAEAVKKGDPGSTAEAGHVPRGILEPAVEYRLFTLPVGGVVDEPVDTPRGYWILRRNK